MFEIVFVSLAVIGAVIASITDIKKGIIPNRLTFSLVGIGIIGNLVYGIYERDFGIFILAIESIVLIFVIGYLFWIVGGWSAGDVKEFMFLAVLLPQYPVFLKEFFTPAQASYPFILTIFINTFISIFPFIMMTAIVLALFKTGISEFFAPVRDIRRYLVKSFFILPYYILFLFIGLYSILIIILFYTVKRKYNIKDIKTNKRLTFIIAAGIIVLYLIKFPSDWKILPIYFVALTTLYLIWGISLNSLKIVRKDVLQSEMRISDLKEGMVLAQEIYIDKDRILRNDEDLLEKIGKIIKTRDMSLLTKKKRIIATTNPAGVTPDQIETLKGYVNRGELEDRIRLKKSIPFAPVILLGLLLSLIFGDIPSIILK